MLERWLPVIGLENSYQVSDLGHVRSLPRIVSYKRGDDIVQRRYDGKEIIVSPQPSGHLKVGLGRKKGIRVSKEVHVLVLESFVGPKPDGLEGRHLDGIPDHNNLNNLCWGTRSENSKDALCHGARLSGERHFRAKLTDNQVRLMRTQFKNKSYSELAAIYSVSKSTVAQIAQGRKWKYVI